MLQGEAAISDKTPSLRQTLYRGWSLLGSDEKLGAVLGLVIFCAAAIASSLMIGSLFPFLAVLADPGQIDTMPFMAAFGAALGLVTAHDFLVAIGVASIVVILLACALLTFRSFYISRYCEFFVYRLSRRLLQHYLAQPYPFFLDHHSGDLATTLLSEAEQVSRGFLRPTADLFASCLSVGAVLIMLLAIDPVVAGGGLLVITSFYGIILLSCRRMASRLGKQRLAANALRYRTASEVIGGIKDVKLTGREDAYVGRFSAPARDMADANSRIAIVTEAPRFALQFLAFGGLILLCLVLVGPETLGTNAGLGSLIPALGLLAFAAQRLSPEVHTAYSAITQLRFGAIVLEKISETLEHSPRQPSEVASAPAPLRLRTSVALRDVTYGYPRAEYAGIRELTLTIEAGERIGIVGSTGAGKTTLADVILGLLPPQSGTLSVDGTQIDRANVRAWQRTIGYVPQEIFLTDTTLRENIALGIDPEEIDTGRVEHCARLAQIHDYIVSELPHGYDTKTGERGVRLSGGQRQRIGIARALYRDADLIVLDEATSALDTVTEREVLTGIEALPGNKTVIMIAHRLSTLRSCTRLVVMERGRIAAAGPWDILMAASPAFRELVQHSEAGVRNVAE
ncbi:MAG: ABC transporter ATP-binding protein [Pseudomonadota bacterium]